MKVSEEFARDNSRRIINIYKIRKRHEEMPELYREKRNEMKCIEGKGRRLRVSNIMIKG